MPAHNYSDSATATTLAADFDSDTDSTLTVAALSGYPAVPFYIAIKRGLSDQQILSVTAVAGTTLTVTPVSGSSATHASGSTVEHVAPATHFDTVEDHMDAVAAHGATGAVVGTMNTQTLTAKTMSGASNTFSNIPQSAVTSLTTDLAAKAPLSATLLTNSAAAAATGSLTLTTTVTDVPGASVTITTAVASTVVIVTGVFDMQTSSTTTGDIGIGLLDVDGTSQTPIATFQAAVAGATTFRSTVTQTWRVTLASAGSHTLKLRANKSANTGGTIAVQTTHTTITVLGRF